MAAPEAAIRQRRSRPTTYSRLRLCGIDEWRVGHRMLARQWYSGSSCLAQHPEQLAGGVRVLGGQVCRVLEQHNTGRPSHRISMGRTTWRQSHRIVIGRTGAVAYFSTSRSPGGSLRFSVMYRLVMPIHAHGSRITCECAGEPAGAAGCGRAPALVCSHMSAPHAYARITLPP